MSDKIATGILMAFALACGMWCFVASLTTVWAAFEKEPRLFIPITGVIAGFICAAIVSKLNREHK